MTAKSGKDTKKTGASTSNKPGVGTGSTSTAKKGKNQNSSGRDTPSQNDHGKSDPNASVPRNVRAERDDSVMRPMDQANTESRNSSAEGRGRRND